MMHTRPKEVFPMRYPSGQQFEISWASQRAVIVEVGGGIRVYEDGGRPVLESYAAEDICDGAHGALLVPWPNRIRDGGYSFEGKEYGLALSEPDRQNAIHGLVRWQGFQALAHERQRVLMGTTLHPSPGYPFRLDITAEYALGEDGLSVLITAENIGASPCPIACGQHPYLSTGGAALDDCMLQFRADTYLATDERQLPRGREAVSGSAFDFAQARAIGALHMDTAFTDLPRDEHGRVHVALAAPDGKRVAFWADRHASVLQLYSGDTLAPSRMRRSLAAEPMTAPADAFRTGEGLRRLLPGERLCLSWGARLL